MTCGGGVKSRFRSIQEPAKNGGAPCWGPTSVQKNCDRSPCIVDCRWDNWGQWSACSRTCGGGNRQRMRTVEQQPVNGGLPCSGPSLQDENCQINACPVDCRWDNWGQWTTCSKTCGGGNRQRTRTIGQVAEHGGLACSGLSSEEQTCQTNGCPVSCIWGGWEQWSSCSRTCGGGTRQRTRTVQQAAQHGGPPCLGQSSQNENCQTNACPVHCRWGNWGHWSTCSKSCGTGNSYRYRSIELQAANGGTPCSGQGSETTSCQITNTAECVTQGLRKMTFILK